MSFRNGDQETAISRPRSFPRSKIFVGKQKFVPRTPSFKQVKHMIKREVENEAETKEVTTVFTDVISIVGTVNGSPLSSMTQGVDQGQRIGRHITLQYIQIDIVLTLVTPSPYVAPFGDAGRVSVILDKQPNALSLPSYGTIYDTTTAYAGSAFRNTLQTGERFKVLRTFDYQLYSGNNGLVKWTCYIPMQKAPERERNVEYSSFSAGVPETNNILVVYGSSVPIVTATETTINCTFRIKYKDM